MGLTLKQAVESGKRFGRKGFNKWIEPRSLGNLVSIENALAEDWELEPEEKIEITKEHFNSVMKNELLAQDGWLLKVWERLKK